MNSFKIWRAVNPSPAEVNAACAAFEGLDVSDILPRLVMVRRAVAARYYTDTLPKNGRFRGGKTVRTAPTTRTRRAGRR